MSQPQGVKVRLRRLGVPPRQLNLSPEAKTDQIIMKNLEPLKKNTKKKDAQYHYYQNHPQHRSPLMRGERGPVHQRLGVKQIRLKRLVPLGTNTASVLPKKRFFRQQRPQNMRVQNTVGNFRQFRRHRMYSAQFRLERIRSQQRNNNNSVIKLRRLNGGIPPATNLTVQVKNPEFVPTMPMNNGTGFTYERFKMKLNHSIQAEIEELQRENGGTLEPLPPLTRITPFTTNIPISVRFSLL